ncbi:MAG: DUF512 domain-containing protein [Oscillospiraceae bacterium]|nr:DUF512 domain-containing protein [Oscillospiraceae bacterium]
MNAAVVAIVQGSPMSRTKVAVGDVLRAINGVVVEDLLDYKYLSYDSVLILEFLKEDGKTKLIRLRKAEGEDLGLVFDSFLMDRQRACANKCVFCFIDQLPKGMRKSLYYKDDDVRLSFLQGNYVTLTNLSEHDVERIISLHISPINVSVHTMEPALRALMLGRASCADRGVGDTSGRPERKEYKDNKAKKESKDISKLFVADDCGTVSGVREAESAAYAGDAGISALVELARAGIELNCQIVCCPGVNDGAELSRTLRGLMALGKSIRSVSVVPVGLTKHREGLPQLRPYDKEAALDTVRRVAKFSLISLKKRGSRLFYCGDELFIQAGLTLPRYSYYEDFPQLENGVGMMRLFITQFYEELFRLAKDEAREAWETQETQETQEAREARESRVSRDRNEFTHELANDWKSGGPVKLLGEPFSVATGVAAAKYLTNLLKIASMRYDTIAGKLFCIKNDFFGHSITVSGLVTGGDIINQLKGKQLGSRLLIPRNMLRSGESVFLDNVTVEMVSEALGVPVRVVEQDGADLLHACMGF